MPRLPSPKAVGIKRSLGRHGRGSGLIDPFERRRGAMFPTMIPGGMRSRQEWPGHGWREGPCRACFTAFPISFGDDCLSRLGDGSGVPCRQPDPLGPSRRLSPTKARAEYRGETGIISRLGRELALHLLWLSPYYPDAQSDRDFPGEHERRRRQDDGGGEPRGPIWRGITEKKVLLVDLDPQTNASLQPHERGCPRSKSGRRSTGPWPTSLN